LLTDAMYKTPECMGVIYFRQGANFSDKSPQKGNFF